MQQREKKAEDERPSGSVTRLSCFHSFCDCLQQPRSRDRMRPFRVTWGKKGPLQSELPVLPFPPQPCRRGESPVLQAAYSRRETGWGDLVVGGQQGCKIPPAGLKARLSSPVGDADLDAERGPEPPGGRALQLCGAHTGTQGGGFTAFSYSFL